ncbi:MAG TPA: fibronectin type III domain-containing protein [Actinomycetota bacterium]|nr:fibronectin type III domain-containing protein [Actinomycetota bacterium]
MIRRTLSTVGICLAGALALPACTGESLSTGVAPKTGSDQAAVPFKDATLVVEINATDGDAGLQVFLDHEPWKSITISRPDGTRILDMQAREVLSDYGLTELFSESSEPPFKEFPLDEFRKLFPEGEYTFTGETIEGTKMHSTVPLSHDFPEGPTILSPEEDSTVNPAELVVRWDPVPEQAGVEITGYQVVVVREDPLQTLEADLPATATEMSVPTEFLESGTEYKVEVLAIEASGNATLTEITFSTE